MLGLQQSMLELSLVALGLTFYLLVCLCRGNVLLQIHCSVHCCSVVPCMNPVSATTYHVAAVTWVWGSGVGTVPTSHVQLNAGVLDSVVPAASLGVTSVKASVAGQLVREVGCFSVGCVLVLQVTWERNLHTTTTVAVLLLITFGLCGRNSLKLLWMVCRYLSDVSSTGVS